MLKSVPDPHGEHVVEVGHPFRVDVEDRHLRAHADSDLRGVRAGDAPAENRHLRRGHPRHAAQQHTPTAERLLQIPRPFLRRQPTGDLAHRLEAGQHPAGDLDRLVGHRADAAGEQAFGQRPTGRQVQIGEQDLPLAQQFDLIRLRLLDLDDHLAVTEDFSAVGQQNAPRVAVLLVVEAGPIARAGLDEHLMPRRHVRPDAIRRQPDAILMPLDLLDRSQLHISSPLGCCEIIIKSELYDEIRI